jgi:hypothetical protein
VARGQLVRQQSDGGGGALGAPTLSEWGAILMTLLFVALGTFFIIGRTRATALAGEAAQSQAPARAIDWKLWAKIAVVVEAATLAALVALKADAVDTSGALAAGLIVAFTLHLFISNWRR